MTPPLRTDQTPVCDSCGEHFDGNLETARALGWGYWAGENVSGTQTEHVICRRCRTDSQKRAVKPAQKYEDEPLF